MEWSLVVLFVAGLTALVLGSEMLVRGASSLSFQLGISPLIVGLTLVAFGTGSPELAVGAYAAWIGQDDLLVGNVVGSNIANILLVLGIAALMAPVAVARQVLRLDAPIMIGASLLLIVLALDAKLGLLDGLVLTLGIIAYTTYLLRKKDRASPADMPSDTPAAPSRRTLARDGLKIIFGLVLLVMGAQWLINSAVAIAGVFNVPEWIIGLTVVAVGTSLPELATTIVASLRGERDLAVGNAVGSCTFNILAVLGISSLIAPGGIQVADAALHLDLPIMLTVAMICLPLFVTGRTIVRWEGGLLLGCYVAYTAFLLLSTTPANT